MMPDSTVYKRLETDREYRARLLEHPDIRGLLRDQARTFCNIALDDVGDLVDCPRRIVEACIEPRARKEAG